MYENLLKYTDPSWHEVLTEQGQLTTPVREIPVKKEYKRMDWESDEQYNYRIYCYDHQTNHKAIQAYKKIIKYGYPKRCPIINRISNLLFI